MKKYLYSLIVGGMLFSFVPAQSIGMPRLPFERQILACLYVITSVNMAVGIGTGLSIVISSKKQ